jgi:hypothetical protein
VHLERQIEDDLVIIRFTIRVSKLKEMYHKVFLKNQQLLIPKRLRENSRLTVHKVKMGDN